MRKGIINFVSVYDIRTENNKELLIFIYKRKG